MKVRNRTQCVVAIVAAVLIGLVLSACSGFRAQPVAAVQAPPTTTLIVMTPVPGPTEVATVTQTVVATVTVAPKAAPVAKKPAAPATAATYRKQWCDAFNKRLAQYRAYGAMSKTVAPGSAWSKATKAELDGIFAKYLKAGGKVEDAVTRSTPLDYMFSEDTMLNC